MPEAKKTVSAKDTLVLHEKEMLRLLVSYGFEKVSEELHVCEYLIQETGDLKFETPICQKIFTLYKQALKQGVLPGPEYFLKSEDSEVKKEVIGMITSKHEMSLHWEHKHQIYTNREFDDLSKTMYASILRLKRRVLRKMLDEAMIKLKESPEEEVAEFQKVYMDLKQYQIQIDKQLGIVISN